MTWTTLTFKVTTPIFNGGADADTGHADGDGIRVASIRGAMRFWFRALAGTIAGPDLELLGALEREVFGNAGTASPVQLRIPAQPTISRNARPGFTGGEGGQWLIYLLGQGLTQYNKQDKKFDVTRPYVDAGQEFAVRLRFASKDAGALALASLWLASMYGGFGARTRRGFGGVQITGAPDDLPGPWTVKSLIGDGLADYREARALYPAAGGELDQCRQILAGLRARVLKDLGRDPGTPPFGDSWTSAPPYPVLSKERTICGLTGGDAFPAWDDALCWAGDQLRYFRASRPNRDPDARYKPKIKTPEWEDVIWGHGHTDHFTVGALGLPVVFKENHVVNVDRGEEKLRRASPLWLRVVGTDGDWRVLSFAFLGQFLPGPDAPQIHHWDRRGKQELLRVDDDDIRSLATQWIDAAKRQLSFDDDIKRT